jgi:NADPH2:quinone reductase
MRAIRPAAPGGPEVLQLVDAPDPAPGRGQARVRVEYAGVNFIDVYHRTGLYPMPTPIPIGREGAGVIEAVGADCDLKVGARVAWAGVGGSYATHVIAPWDVLVPVPDALDSKIAAALMLQGMTAQYLTRTTYRLKINETCLLHAAAGGVGLLASQLASRAGAVVIGTVSTDEKADRARKAGCTHVIRYDREDLVKRVKELTGGRGVDVVYDSVGKATFMQSLDCLRPRGMMVLFGASSGPVPPIDLQLLNQKGSIYVTRPNLSHYTATRNELLERAGDVLGAAAHDELAVTIDRVLPLAEAAEAHRLLESRATIGKVLLDCR